MSTDKGIERMIELYDKFLINPDREVSKKIDMVVYIGESVGSTDSLLGKKQKWPKKIIKALKRMDANFYKEFNLSFNYQFRKWYDNHYLWTPYFSDYHKLTKEEKVFGRIDESAIKIFIEEYESARHFKKGLFDLIIQHNVLNNEDHSRKIIFEITESVEIRNKSSPFPDVCLGTSFELKDDGHIPSNNNYGYVVMGYSWNGNSPSKLSKTIQHEISHLFGAEHCRGRSVMNDQLGRCKRWDKESKEIIRRYIENLSTC